MGGFEHRLIVERDVGPTGLPHLSDERGLASSARSHDQNHWGIRKGFFCPALYKPFEHPVPESPDNWNYLLRLIGRQQSANWNPAHRDLEASVGGKAFPCGRAKVSPDPFCGDTPQRPRVRVRAGFAVTG